MLTRVRIAALVFASVSLGPWQAKVARAQGMPLLACDDSLSVALTSSDPILGGMGRSRTFAMQPGISGHVFLWTRGTDLDLFLRVEDGAAKLLKQDDDSGGGKTPYVMLEVEPDSTLRVTVASKAADALGPLELCLRCAPETDDTREASQRASQELQEVRRLRSAKQLDEARARIAALIDELVELIEAEDSWMLAQACQSCGFESYGLSLPQPTERAWQATIELLSRMLPDDHASLQTIRENLALMIRDKGDLAGARALQEKVFAVRLRTLPDDDRQLQVSRLNLAGTLYQLGDLIAARALEEKALEVLSGTLPDAHPDLQRARGILAVTIQALGDLPRARVLGEKVLEVFSRTLPEDDPELQLARGNLAETLRVLGDLAGARLLVEKMLEVGLRTLPADHPDLQRAREYLGKILREIGDLPGARALEEKVLEARSRTLPEDHPDLQRARSDFALLLGDLGDLAGARAFEEKVIEVYSRTRDDDDLDLQHARGNLANTLKGFGQLAEARAIEERIHHTLSRTLPDDHPLLQITRQNLASTIADLGDFAGARTLFENALEICSRRLPADHPDLQVARLNLAVTTSVLGDSRAARSACQALAQGMSDGVRSALASLSQREVAERCALEEFRLGVLCSSALGYGVSVPDPDLDRVAAGAVELLRAADLVSARILHHVGTDSALLDLRREAAMASDEVVHLAQVAGNLDPLRTAIAKRDAAQRVLAEALSRRGVAKTLLIEPTVDALCAKLASRDALVGYRRYTRHRCSKKDVVVREKPVECLLAYVYRPGSTLSRVELGPIDAVEHAVSEWRDALGISTGRGARAIATVEQPNLRDAGDVLRRLIFDPLRPAIGDAGRLVVAFDDVLHTVALDALPGETTETAPDTLLGECLRIETRVSLREILWEASPVAEDGSLLALGGAAFDSQPTEVSAKEDAARLAPAPAANVVATLLRGGAWEHGFEPLAHTALEVRGIAALFERTFAERQAFLLEDRNASRASVARLASSVRNLHLATHGWFAPEAVHSSVDRTPLDRHSSLGMPMTFREQVRAASPMVLCGLALAGANLPADELGHYPGLVTAEEIANWDLTGCELAVLSACDTNVGVRRVGQGVASLQKALHMAGARSVITSLWKVPDEATKELMLDFYRRVWVEKQPKSRALWEAKMRLRHANDARGALRYSTRDWAGWVLTGDPD